VSLRAGVVGGVSDETVRVARAAFPKGCLAVRKRNGTTTLFAALEVATGKVSADACYQRHTNRRALGVGSSPRRYPPH
jgi:hypothetical protein